MQDQTLARFHLNGEAHYIFATWRKDEFTLVVYDGERVWETDSPITIDYTPAGMESGQWLARCRAGLEVQDTSNSEFGYIWDVNGDFESTLTLTMYGEEDNRSGKRFGVNTSLSLQLAEDGQEVTRRIMNFVIDRHTAVSSEKAQLATAAAQLREQRAKVMADLKQTKQDKLDMEQDLYSRFAVVLNKKREKAWELNAALKLAVRGKQTESDMWEGLPRDEDGNVIEPDPMDTSGGDARAPPVRADPPPPAAAVKREQEPAPVQAAQPGGSGIGLKRRMSAASDLLSGVPVNVNSQRVRKRHRTGAGGPSSGGDGFLPPDSPPLSTRGDSDDLVSVRSSVVMSDISSVKRKVSAAVGGSSSGRNGGDGGESTQGSDVSRLSRRESKISTGTGDEEIPSSIVSSGPPKSTRSAIESKQPSESLYKIVGAKGSSEGSEVGKRAKPGGASSEPALSRTSSGGSSSSAKPAVKRGKTNDDLYDLIT